MPAELLRKILERLVDAIEGPLGLLLLLACLGLVIFVRIVWLRWQADLERAQARIDELARRLDEIQEERVDDARQGLFALSTTTSLLNSLAATMAASAGRSSGLAEDQAPFTPEAASAGPDAGPESVLARFRQARREALDVAARVRALDPELG